MSGTYDIEPTPAEQHLGDRLAALVDGELGHETRERVLAHLATCHSCKAEADAQRRLKSVFAAAEPPSPPESLLARLQGLPAGVDEGPGPDGPLRPPGSAWDFEYLSSGSALTPERGFRIHEPDRAASRGRRFAFAAAGAVSVAAFAIGGALSSTVTGGSPTAGGGGTTVSPLRTAAVGAERGQDRGLGMLGGPPAAPAPSATRPVSRPPSGSAVRQYELMTVPVLDMPLSPRPPLIRPTQYAARQLDLGLPERHGADGEPLAGAPSPATVAATVPAVPPGH
ncbi:MAG TPA: zf-HC2 domain-containing protein [Streptomyces sp.]|nr:zf-HC2 domain-containing protein [Streptomyces sp.]